ncbi:MAG: alpha-amylase [Candidatus Woesearchaeota archaeon]|nr:alpha-amylase [Candidatus Woesearchaeota archaeon]
MVNICFYFQLHQPFRLKRYRIFDIGRTTAYFDEKKNYEIMEKVSKKSYIPTTRMILDLIERYPKFKVAFSFSGVFIEQAKRYFPNTYYLLKKIGSSENVEFLSETYYHSLSFLHSIDEFNEQIEMHRELIRSEFGKDPSCFRNTELIYSDWIADFAAKKGFKGMLAEGAQSILKNRSPNFLYLNKDQNIKVLLKNFQLSDDIAFRFSERGWKEWPLTAEKYSDWIDRLNGNSDIIGLFMDYETFGEHQWRETGIFDFFRHFIELGIKKGYSFLNPTDAISRLKPKGIIDCPFYLSWADTERDLSAWQGNSMQKDALKKIYEIEKMVKDSGNKELIENWRKIQTSDHFYYMCTKYFNDGDVHKYFNPYDTPYEAYIYFMNIFSDIKERIKNEKSSEKNELNVNEESIEISE